MYERGGSAVVSARALNVTSFKSLSSFDHHDGTIGTSAHAVLADDGVDGSRGTDVVPGLRVHRWLIQREPIKPDDFFPSQLVGGAPAHGANISRARLWSMSALALIARRYSISDAVLSPGNPRLDQPAWRAHAAAHDDARP